ncbi:MAG TPA: SDR family oxidoreductase [Blastocatellia bacterium]|jgi:NAD(P)-dependent dehydrogenase (short-subunit alcohol dehydrogenase family)
MKNNMTGKTCLVTGANSGIGKATAEALARMGARVAIVCRSRERGLPALEEIKKKSDTSTVELMTCDFASQKQIRRLADEFLSGHDRLDVLINNAGLMRRHRETTEEGLEMTFAVNHLGYFLLTNLLLDMLKKSAPSRIVNVASVAHMTGTINFDDLQGERDYSSMGAYRQSKLANILFTYELARRLEGTGVTVNCLHPGVIATNIARDMPKAVRLALRAFFKGAEKGAETSIYLAASPDVEGVTGKYFDDKKEARSNQESYSREVALRLWDVSAELTGLMS